MIPRATVYDERRLLSVLLNHLYPDHDVRAMAPFCWLEWRHDTVVLMVPPDVERKNRPHRSS